MTAVLRVDGPELDVEECRKWLPEGSLECVWQVGEKSRRGEVRTTSGFNLVLSESENPRELVRETLRVFAVVAGRVADLVRGGATAEIDFALFVTARGPESLILGPEVLRRIEQHGVGVTVSAYPCSEDDDEDDDDSGNGAGSAQNH